MKHCIHWVLALALGMGLQASVFARETCELNKNAAKIADLKLQTIQKLQDAAKTKGNDCKALRDYIPTLLNVVESSVNTKQIERYQQEEIDYKESVARANAGLEIANSHYATCNSHPQREHCLAEKYVERQKLIEIETGPRPTSDSLMVQNGAETLSNSIATAIESSRTNDCKDDSPVLSAVLGAAVGVTRDAGYFFPGGVYAGVGIQASVAALAKLFKSIFSRPGLHEKLMQSLTAPDGDDAICLMNTINHKLLQCGMSEPSIPNPVKAGVEAPLPADRERFEKAQVPLALRTLSKEIPSPFSDRSEKISVQSYLRRVHDDFKSYETMTKAKATAATESDLGVDILSLLETGTSIQVEKRQAEKKAGLERLDKERNAREARINQLAELTKDYASTEGMELEVSKLTKDNEIWIKQNSNPQETQRIVRENTDKIEALKKRIADVKMLADERAALAKVQQEYKSLADMNPEAAPLLKRDSEVVADLLKAHTDTLEAQKSKDTALIRDALNKYRGAVAAYNTQFTPVGEPNLLLQSRDQEAAFALNHMGVRHAQIMKDLSQSDQGKISDMKRLDLMYRDNELARKQLQARRDEIQELRDLNRDLAQLSNAMVSTYSGIVKEAVQNSLAQARNNNEFPRDAILQCTLGASAFLFDKNVVTARDDSRYAHKWVRVDPDWESLCVPLLACYVPQLYDKKHEREYTWPPQVPYEHEGFFKRRESARHPAATGQEDIVRQVHHYVCKLSMSAGDIAAKADAEFRKSKTICGEKLINIDDKGRKFKTREVAPTKQGHRN